MSESGFDPARFFMEGGWAMYLVLCTGALGHVLAIASLASLFSKRRAMPLGMGAATLLFAVTTLCVGVGGYFMGMRMVEEAVAFADPDSQAMLRAQGQDEADNNLYFGGCAFLVPLLCGLVAVGRGATMKEAPST
ncbi:MAG: hypothetical protein J0L92_40710 [Deltaproteobacteria bacterium]|nr:hypothetical protein [Deltaproteobacteria bacterium]